MRRYAPPLWRPSARTQFHGFGAPRACRYRKEKGMTWAPGDLAVRVGVNRADWPNGWFPENAPPKGAILRVDAVVVSQRGTVSLVFNEWPSPHRTKAWHSASWRKLKPCDPDFLAFLTPRETGKPNKLPVTING
jgi:hypothetical protein